jgi:hypothetical protein
MPERRRRWAALVALALAACGAEPDRWTEVDAATLELGPACLSGRYWALGDRGNNHMHPGRDCIGCHARTQRGPRFSVAGTLYGAGHEVDECLGYDSDLRAGQAAEVELTDAAGERFTVIANRAGNFYTTHPLRFPLRRVRVFSPGGAVIEMGVPAPHGDCNACHTRLGTITGSGEAPGRVVVP